MNIEDLRQLLIRYFFTESIHNHEMIIEMYRVSDWTDEEVIAKVNELGLLNA